jgi:hypothetical protein
LLCRVEAAAACVWGVVGLLAALDAREARRFPLKSPSAEPPVSAKASVSIIAPMRNEAGHVRGWLASARAQGATVCEIIVSDDDSEDATAEIANAIALDDPRVRVLRGSPPSGWVGKTSAADRGARIATGDWLLFSDADMRMAPGTVAAVLAACAKYGADACSLTATLECGTPIEQAVMPAMAAIIMSGHPLVLIHDPLSPVALVWGGFVLVRRDAYFAIGGHAAVRGEIAEDRALAQRLKAFGFRVRLIDGHCFVRVRMYRGFADMWQGWRKNVYEGTKRNPALATLFIAAVIAMLVVPQPALVMLGCAAAHRKLRGTERKLAWWCAVNAAGNLVARALRDRAIGARTLTALAAPIAGAFIASVMTASAWRGVTGRGQTWKGRVIR